MEIQLPKTVNIQDFIDSRKIEQDHFLEILGQKVSKGANMGTKKSF